MSFGFIQHDGNIEITQETYRLSLSHLVSFNTLDIDSCNTMVPVSV